MNIVIVGAGGQLASDLVPALAGHRVVPLPHADLDVCDASAVRARLTRERPDVVINTAAFHRVDECERSPDVPFRVNAIAARDLARVCADLDSTLVSFSTDYVFDGRQRRPYTEDDAPNPLNVYGVTKLAGEYFIRALCPKHFVVRTTGLYGVTGASKDGGNFVETMIRLARAGTPIRVVTDQILTPTYTRDVARTVAELVRTDSYGLYHVTNGGACSWYEFAGAVFTALRLTPDLTPTTAAAYGSAARRPAYSVLAHHRLRAIGLDDLRPWTDALTAYLREKGHLT